MLYYFNKGKNITEMQKKKDLCSFGEGAVWLIKYVPRGLVNFMPEISC